VVVGGAGDAADVGTWKVHVHTADVAGALAAGEHAAGARAAGGRAAGGRAAGAGDADEWAAGDPPASAPDRAASDRAARGGAAGDEVRDSAGDRTAGEEVALPAGSGEAGGGPRQIRVASVLARAAAGGRSATRSVAVVAVAEGAGMAALFAASGALLVVRRPGSAPTPEELLRAVRDTGAAAVVVVPDDAESAVAATALWAADAAADVPGAPAATTPVDEAAGTTPVDHEAAATIPVDEAAGITPVDAAEATCGTVRDRMPQVAVLPPCAPVAALAALAVHDPAQPLAAAFERMSAAAAATRQGAVTTARRVQTTPVGLCRPGDALGLVGAEVVAVGADAAAVGRVVADRLLGSGGELLTVLRGAAPEAGRAADALCRAVREARPDVEVHALDGGQDGALLLLGVE
jgi:dihydroxyacetone kinase-like predicted kinase